MNTNTPKISTVREIGKGIRVSDRLVSEIIDALVPAVENGFDTDARGALAEFIRTFVLAGEAEPAQRKPSTKDENGKTVQGERTDYGVGFDAVLSKVKRLVKIPDTKVTLRVSLSGEDGGSVVVPADHEMYAALVALISESV